MASVSQSAGIASSWCSPCGLVRVASCPPAVVCSYIAAMHGTVLHALESGHVLSLEAWEVLGMKE